MSNALRMLQGADDASPTVSVVLGRDGLPVGAVAGSRLDAAPGRVWSVVHDLERYPDRVPMIHRVRRRGPRVDMMLRLKVAVFSARFGFSAHVVAEAERWLELRHIAGEPDGLVVRFELTPIEEGRATWTTASVSFDVRSLGWLVKFFLRHHPEIQNGVLPGAALTLLGSLRDAVGRGADAAASTRQSR